MTIYRIDTREDQKNILAKPNYLAGKSPSGESISFTNYYMERNGKPFFGICGEFHYCRYHEDLWEDELLKMKMGGINLVCTYIFWNVHEEIEGVYDWSGRRDLRNFVEICGKHDLYVIIRIGPFCHGEIRNGGMPDWLYGRPFNVRSNDERYLDYVRRLYAQISEQVAGLLFGEGGPIIGTQIENEHGHSAAQWAQTTGISNEWMTQGYDGEAHMRVLKQIAVEAGIKTPLYTCTAWGGANAPADEMLPLWGGYSHWPWIYYEHDRFGEMKEHPATPEYIFRDKHNNSIPASYNFEPCYTPEDYPYACCEMGGGMTPFYRYRFNFPYVSVPAMTGIKVAEGCNLIGYYMYHGGSNPTGKRDHYLNDLATPKISYDFNACIGEFGQVRESYHRTRLQHYFFQTYASWFCRTKTILPGDTSSMEPTDTETLRFAVRASEGSGLLFLNNYQDHAQTQDLEVKEGVTIMSGESDIRFPSEGPLKLGKDGFGMLPYRFDLEGVRLELAMAQLITSLTVGDTVYYFFVSLKGMPPEYAFTAASLTELEAESEVQVFDRNDLKVVRHNPNEPAMIRLTSSNGKKVQIVTIPYEQGVKFWKVNLWGQERVLLTDGNLIVSKEQLKLEITDQKEVTMKVFPDTDKLSAVFGGQLLERKEEDLYTVYHFRLPHREIHFGLERVKEDKAVLSFSPRMFEGVKEVLLRIDYAGDIGFAYIDGELINDNFSNGVTWEIGLKMFQEQLIEKGMYLYISPIRKGSVVNSHTTMAGWSENAKELIAVIGSITAVPVSELTWNQE